STDRGTTWQASGPVEEQAGAVDLYLFVDQRTGRIFSAMSVEGCSQLDISDDDGVSWTPGMAGCGWPATDNETIYAGPPPPGGTAPIGYPNVVYYCAIGLGTTSVFALATLCTKSLDGGRTWIDTGTLPFDSVTK